MQRTLTIKNRTREQVTLNLPAGLVPELSQPAPTLPSEPLPRARRVGDRRVDLPGRPSRPVPVAARLSGSITLNARGTPGDTRAGLPPSVKRAPEVQAALAADPPRVSVEVLVSDDLPPVQPQARAATPKGGAR